MQVLKGVRLIKEIQLPGGSDVQITTTLYNPSASGHTLEWLPSGNVIVRHPRSAKFLEILASAIIAYEWADVVAEKPVADAKTNVAEKPAVNAKA